MLFSRKFTFQNLKYNSISIKIALGTRIKNCYKQKKKNRKKFENISTCTISSRSRNWYIILLWIYSGYAFSTKVYFIWWNYNILPTNQLIDHCLLQANLDIFFEISDFIIWFARCIFSSSYRNYRYTMKYTNFSFYLKSIPFTIRKSNSTKKNPSTSKKHAISHHFPQYIFIISPGL